MFDHQVCQVRGSSHFVGWLEGVLCFLLWVMFSVWPVVGRGVLVAGCNRSVVLRGASGNVPEIDL